MSQDNGKVCCNCRRNIRRKENKVTNCYCEITGDYLDYGVVMSYWCKRWASDAKLWNTDCPSNSSDTHKNYRHAEPIDETVIFIRQTFK